MNINIEYVKCIHGFEKRFGKCPECLKDQQKFLLNIVENKKVDNRIPIRKGCTANGGCFCDGSCKEVIGYRDPLFPNEKP